MAGLLPARPPRARRVAADLLARELPLRWAHVQGVARQAERFRPSFDGDRADLLVAAGWVHDIGYREDIRETGFHPVDGARHLRRLGFDERLVSLVARHTCAAVEAQLLGLDDLLDREFPEDHRLPHDELLWCDLTTGPDGGEVTVTDRLAEIRRRYAPGTTVHRFIDRAEPRLLRAAARAERRLLRAAPIKRAPGPTALVSASPIDRPDGAGRTSLRSGRPERSLPRGCDVLPHP